MPIWMSGSKAGKQRYGHTDERVGKGMRSGPLEQQRLDRKHSSTTPAQTYQRCSAVRYSYGLNTVRVQHSVIGGGGVSYPEGYLLRFGVPRYNETGCLHVQVQRIAANILYKQIPAAV